MDLFQEKKNESFTKSMPLNLGNVNQMMPGCGVVEVATITTLVHIAKMMSIRIVVQDNQ